MGYRLWVVQAVKIVKVVKTVEIVEVVEVVNSSIGQIVKSLTRH